MIQPVNALAPKVFFKGRKNELDNPVNRKLEKRLAILNAGGISAVAGALTTAIARSYTASWKNAVRSWCSSGDNDVHLSKVYV